MGRSNTFPNPQPSHSTSTKSASLNRSHTVQTPEHTKLRLPLHIPHPHNPFHKDHAPLHDGSQNGSQNGSPPRPGALNRQNSVQTRYMSMLLGLDTIPRMHNIAASFFTWILLAGFVIFPGTFTSLSTLTNDAGFSSNKTAHDILLSVKHVSLLYIAAFCSGIGAIGMMYLWFRWRANFVWLLNRIFLPGCLNSFAGLISTLVNVYSQQGGNWSVTAWITAAVTGGCMVITGCLFGLYNFWILEKVKKRHLREMNGSGEGDGGEEGLREKIGRKVNEPALEPGSVV